MRLAFCYRCGVGAYIDDIEGWIEVDDELFCVYCYQSLMQQLRKGTNGSSKSIS